MRIVLFVLAIIAFFIGGSLLSQAQGAIHEIEALILFLIGAVFTSAAAVVEAINLLRKETASSRT